MKNLSRIIIGLISFVMAVSAQQMTEVTNWVMQDSSKAAEKTGEAISLATFSTTNWLTAVVPGTVLQTLQDANNYYNLTPQDPMYGLNMNKIEDIAGLQKRFWFRSTFNVSFSSGQRVWLDIEGINYKAYIYVNGHYIDTLFGAFKGGKFDITNNVTSGSNCIAVKIIGNFSPGVYHTKQTGQCGGNGGIMTQDGPTLIASQGWDWIPTIPDRDMGIWKPVYVRVTGPVVIRHPWIRTTNVTASSATVPLQVMLRNATGTPVTGIISANIDGVTPFASQTVTVPANDTLNVSFANLTMTNPRLWWPNGYGDPNLYTCNIAFAPNNADTSDTVSFKFGVRQFTFTTNTGGDLIIVCNGQRILSRGGNWGMDEGMKRWDLHRLEAQVRYHKEMNFNVIRDWIGQTDREPFYDFCDKYGMMVWADFWEPNTYDGPTPATDQVNFLSNMLDKIYRTRNHACIAIWCERNETTPTTAFLTALTNMCNALDGTRRVQGSSGSGGVHSGGPYTYTSPTAANSAIYGFHTEFGGPTPLSFESMNAAGIGLPLGIGNSTASFHDFCQGNGYPGNFTDAMTSEFGSQTDLQQMTKVAQLMNYDDYRAPFEVLQTKRFSGATGLLLWMSNCVWPSLMWQTYDYYLEGTGAMYGCMKGSEPIHVQFYNSNSIQVINNTRQPISNYTVSAATYNLAGTKAWNNSQAISVGADSLANAFPVTQATGSPNFLDIKLKDAGGNIVSKNFYWLPNSGTNISGMLTMNKAVLVPTATANWVKTGTENTITFKVVDTSAVCAIACRLQVITRNTNTRVLPVHYNDNYFSLAPGDTQFVSVKFDDADTKGDYPVVSITGINVDYTAIDVNPAGVRRSGSSIVKKSGMFGRWTGRNLKIFNIPTGNAWHVAILNIGGRTVLKADGVGTNGEIVVDAAALRPGAYIATIKSDVETYRAMIMVTAKSGR
jgi:Exo-beta-D-glucosaminidase Ig-fold domain/Glycosyl hydrolases family 2/Glycosyl hydrolases family 2, sugar binding domain/Glycosyl hydrolases family 2, TIM barrel domain